VTSTSMSIVQRRWLAQTLVDNQIRPTSPTTSVNDAAWIPALWIDSSELFGTSSGPAVLAQERCKVRHVLRSRQTYFKALLQRLLVLRSTVEVAPMITLMG
jgi:hypothetical protein